MDEYVVERCDWCGRRLDRPSFAAECASKHPAADLAEVLVEDVEREMHGRRGIGWDFLDDSIVDDIRDSLVARFRRRLALAQGA